MLIWEAKRRYQPFEFPPTYTTDRKKLIRKIFKFQSVRRQMPQEKKKQKKKENKKEENEKKHTDNFSFLILVD